MNFKYRLNKFDSPKIGEKKVFPVIMTTVGCLTGAVLLHEYGILLRKVTQTQTAGDWATPKHWSGHRTLTQRTHRNLSNCPWLKFSPASCHSDPTKCRIPESGVWRSALRKQMWACPDPYQVHSGARCIQVPGALSLLSNVCGDVLGEIWSTVCCKVVKNCVPEPSSVNKPLIIYFYVLPNSFGGRERWQVDQTAGMFRGYS